MKKKYTTMQIMAQYRATTLNTQITPMLVSCLTTFSVQPTNAIAHFRAQVLCSTDNIQRYQFLTAFLTNFNMLSLTKTSDDLTFFMHND